MYRRTFLGLATAAAAVGASKIGVASPNERYIIMPDITRCERYTKTIQDNCYTLHYEWMSRLDTKTKSWEMAHVNTCQYREWLEGYKTETGLPPHIQFGGAVKSIPGGDPTFYNRWLDYARKTFV